MTTTPDASAQPDITEEHAAELLISWDMVEKTASRLIPAGPRMKPSEAKAEVQALRQAAADAVPHVHRITGIAAAEHLGEDLSDVRVVDRAGWARANTQTFRQLLGPALHAAARNKPELAQKEGSAGQVLGASAAGAELGAILGYLSAQVLGQFEPFEQSRLLLTAPNVVTIAEELNVERDDFRLWVCLHEQTHRVQFAAAPWLADHLRGKITELSASTMAEADSLPERIAETAKQVRAELQEGRRPGRKQLLSAIQTPEQRETLSHLTAVMSLLEGHANVVMDAVDADVVPTVKTIRRRFNERAKRRSPMQRIVRRLLQLDKKAAQYKDGQSFVSRAVELVGMDQFNTVWEAPEHLPTENEIHDAEAWVSRVGLKKLSDTGAQTFGG
ncbi:zinc-dependent metalloprotease [Nesterenkonia populi]